MQTYTVTLRIEGVQADDGPVGAALNFLEMVRTPDSNWAVTVEEQTVRRFMVCDVATDPVCYSLGPAEEGESDG